MYTLTLLKLISNRQQKIPAKLPTIIAPRMLYDNGTEIIWKSASSAINHKIN
uniref:Uncharacterized protein n=1 Tax=Arundo donax TaxID=35708 RepID=A0A0A9CX38_ARUDO